MTWHFPAEQQHNVYCIIIWFHNALLWLLPLRYYCKNHAFLSDCSPLNTSCSLKSIKTEWQKHWITQKHAWLRKKRWWDYSVKHNLAYFLSYGWQSNIILSQLLKLVVEGSLTFNNSVKFNKLKDLLARRWDSFFFSYPESSTQRGDPFVWNFIWCLIKPNSFQ